MVYLVVAALAGVENLFPPVPADTAVALGAFLSQRGAISASAVFGCTWLANVSTAAGVYLGARTLGRRFFTGRLGRRLLRPRALRRLERLYARFGLWGIFVSRFIPGVRAVVPPFAGVAGLGPVRALVPMAVASGIWYGVLTYLAVAVAQRLDDLIRLVGHVNRVALVVGGGLVAVVIVLVVVRSRRSGTRRGAHGDQVDV